MPLDFYLADTADHLILGTLQPRLSLPEAGLTGLLLAIQEFTGPARAGAGPSLDACGTSVFGRADLPRFRESLTRAAAHFREGPASFQVWIGREVIPIERALFQEVHSNQGPGSLRRSPDSSRRGRGNSNGFVALRRRRDPPMRALPPNPSLQRTRAGGCPLGLSRTRAYGRPEKPWNGTGR